ncbi:MAG: hypothetical protein LQ340_001235 [Diploschistes diacapsis]|nr:MAG: hypothetical protein LQ340_001235 [Diploschistes diacapsis]
MSLALSEVKSEEAYAPIVLVEDEAFSTPPNQFYQVLKGPSREEYRARTWKKHLDQGNKSHWLVVTDSNTRQPLGAAHWLVHETDPFEHSKPRPALDATWQRAEGHLNADAA